MTMIRGSFLDKLPSFKPLTFEREWEVSMANAEYGWTFLLSTLNITRIYIVYDWEIELGIFHRFHLVNKETDEFIAGSFGSLLVS